MGLVLAPLILLWLVGVGFALRVGYVLAGVSGFFPQGALCFLVAIAGGQLYARWLQGRRRSEESLWTFQLVIDFVLNKAALVLYTLLAATYLMSDVALMDENLLSLIFVGTLMLSTGTLTGVFTSESFMDRHDIKRTY